MVLSLLTLCREAGRKEANVALTTGSSTTWPRLKLCHPQGCNVPLFSHFPIFPHSPKCSKESSVSPSVIAWGSLPPHRTSVQLSLVTLGHTEAEYPPVLHGVVRGSSWLCSGVKHCLITSCCGLYCAVAPEARVLHVRPVPTALLYPVVSHCKSGWPPALILLPQPPKCSCDNAWTQCPSNSFSFRGT